MFTSVTVKVNSNTFPNTLILFQGNVFHQENVELYKKVDLMRKENLELQKKVLSI